MKMNKLSDYIYGFLSAEFLIGIIWLFMYFIDYENANEFFRQGTIVVILLTIYTAIFNYVEKQKNKSDRH